MIEPQFARELSFVQCETYPALMWPAFELFVSALHHYVRCWELVRKINAPRDGEVTRFRRQEFERRLQIWAELKSHGGPRSVSPALVKTLGIHRGEQGVFRDQNLTASSTGVSNGVAVGVLYTGRVYSDELSEEGLTYHYPNTNRGTHDANEIRALKACKDYGLPLFVVVKTQAGARTRDVRLGWVQDYEDVAGLLLICFREYAGAETITSVEAAGEAFELRVSSASRRVSRITRPNQWRFRFDVLKRYGVACAVCRITHPDLLQAAHLCPVTAGGCYDARNGLVLCHTHHNAFDRGLFRIHPDSLSIHVDDSYVPSQFAIERTSILHLPSLPHVEALRWAWESSH